MNHYFLSCKECIQESATNVYGCFYLGPFNSSQSLTVANALRRTLLSEIPGLGILHLEIDGVAHEFTTVKGLRESVLDVLLNFKQIVLKKTSSVSINKPFYGYLSARGPGTIRAADLQLPPSIQCVDPDQYIATLNEDGILQLKFSIVESKNKGFPSFFEKNLNLFKEDSIFTEKKGEKKENQYSNTFNTGSFSKMAFDGNFLHSNIQNPLFVDPLFNPIHKVNYTIQTSGPLKQTKTNQIVIIELWTNGSLHPREALYLGLTNLKDLFLQLDQMKLIHSLLAESKFTEKESYAKLLKNIEYDYTNFKKTKFISKNQLGSPEMNSKLQSLKTTHPQMSHEFVEFTDQTIDELFLPFRIYNCLKNHKIYYIKDLLQLSSTELLQFPGFGKYCLTILEESLKKKGLQLNSKSI